MEESAAQNVSSGKNINNHDIISLIVQASPGLDQTINDRAGGMEQYEERKGGDAEVCNLL